MILAPKFCHQTATYLLSRTSTPSLQGKPSFKKLLAQPGGPALTRADVARLAAAVASALPVAFGDPDETKQTIARALAEAGQTRTWNVMIDVIAQTGKYAPGHRDLTDATKASLSKAKSGIGSISRLIATMELCSARSLRKWLSSCAGVPLSPSPRLRCSDRACYR